MPIEYRLNAAARRFECTHVGAVPDEQFMATYQRMYADPAFDGSFDILVDLTQAESSPRGVGALKMIADLGRERHGGGERVPRIAIVASADLSFGLARMYEGLAVEVPANVRVFRELARAVAWLDEPREDP